MTPEKLRERRRAIVARAAESAEIKRRMEIAKQRAEEQEKCISRARQDSLSRQKMREEIASMRVDPSPPKQPSAPQSRGGVEWRLVVLAGCAGLIVWFVIALLFAVIP